MASMTELDAQMKYAEYVSGHIPTKADPLRTFSGWLIKNGIHIRDWTPYVDACLCGGVGCNSCCPRS